MKDPCPNLKKLIVPASTTATTTIFFPVFNARNGFGFFAATGVEGANAHGKILRIDNVPGVGIGVDVEADCGDAATNFCCANDIRLRGTGGGNSGSMSKRFVSSVNDGIEVVRALQDWDLNI